MKNIKDTFIVHMFEILTDLEIKVSDRTGLPSITHN